MKKQEITISEVQNVLNCLKEIQSISRDAVPISELPLGKVLAKYKLQPKWSAYIKYNLLDTYCWGRTKDPAYKWDAPLPNIKMSQKMIYECRKKDNTRKKKEYQKSKEGYVSNRNYSATDRQTIVDEMIKGTPVVKIAELLGRDDKYIWTYINNNKELFDGIAIEYKGYTATLYYDKLDKEYNGSFDDDYGFDGKTLRQALDSFKLAIKNIESMREEEALEEVLEEKSNNILDKALQQPIQSIKTPVIENKALPSDFYTIKIPKKYVRYPLYGLGVSSVLAVGYLLGKIL